MKKFLTLVILSIVLLASCGKDDSNAPVLPEAETLSVNLDSFRDNGTKADGGTGDFFAYVSVKVVSNWLHIFDNVINVPVEAYKQLVVSAVPVKSGKGWTWTVDYRDYFGVHYTVELYGEEKHNKVYWDLRVSKNDGEDWYKDFPWISGWSTKDGKSGQWEVRVNPYDMDIMLTSDWEVRGPKDRTVLLTYKLTHQYWGISQLINESYLRYSTTASDAAYDSSIESCYNHDGIGSWSVNVEWNSVTGAGRVMSSSRFGDTSWHSWSN